MLSFSRLDADRLPIRHADAARIGHGAHRGACAVDAARDLHHNLRRAPCGAVFALHDESVSVARRPRLARSNSIPHAADTAEDQLLRRAQHSAKGALRICAAATLDPASTRPTAALAPPRNSTMAGK